ncbi:Phosphate-binding protein [Bordetella ansorpii]|uniref:Phosphate-binding protein n=1 Tax=Bordetella ansorpii TaxID=288768 RepID=A0A157SF59_9BORD|nr:substrate-binding domain-containing protein [Bordetella ansorpii]SAI69102.1 Phosphate-binding protein [Bordetella ansorpii]
MSFKTGFIAFTLGLILVSEAAVVMAQKVVTGGSTLPHGLYNDILPIGPDFSYTGKNSVTGKTAVLTNNGSLFSVLPSQDFSHRSVVIAASDVVITPIEELTYSLAHNPSVGYPPIPAVANWGPVLQMPSVGTSVTIPFNKNTTAGTAQALNFRGTLSNSLPDFGDLCGVFSGRISDWSQIAGSNRVGPITVLYREEGSGTSALLGNFLNAACAAEASPSNLKGGMWTVDQPNFAQQFNDDTVPYRGARFISVKGSSGMRDAVFADQGRIGYVGPDVIPTSDLADATKFALLRGFSPTAANTQLAIAAAPVPNDANANTRSAWLPNFGVPFNGYAIAGFTSWVVSQCFTGTDTNDTVATMTTFLNDLYDGDFDATITADNFVPLSIEWKNAVKSTFLSNTSGRGMNIANSTVCNGIGKPLQ